MERLTERQKQVLDFIVSHTKEKGYPPTYREIGETVGLKSSSAVFGHIEQLEKKGYIKRIHGSSRAIEVISRHSDQTEVQIVKWHKDIPSVIRWMGRRYVYDPFR